MNRTPLHTLHKKSGATFTQLFGWAVAGSFGDVAHEYRAATEGVALLDRSYTGHFRVKGKDALDLLNRLSSNKVDVLPPGTGAGTVLTTNKGRVIDLLHLFALEGHWLMLTSPQTRQRVAEWIDTYTFLEEVSLEDVTEATAMVTLLGPKTQALLERVTGSRLERLEPYDAVNVTIQGIRATLLRTEPVGDKGYDLVLPAEQAEESWSALVHPSNGATPVGEDAFNALRVEKGVPRFGWEISEDVNPWEVNLQGFIHSAKGCYVGQEVILRLNTYDKVQRHLMALSFSSAGVREEAVLRMDDKEAGKVTSVVRHPVSGETIGLGLVRTAFAKTGTELEVVGGEGEASARAFVNELASMVPTSP